MMVDMSPSLIPQTVHSSDLSRNSAAVFKAVDQGPVTITRRDGEALILTCESQQTRAPRSRPSPPPKAGVVPM
jgi:hypothetical protein